MTKHDYQTNLLPRFPQENYLQVRCTFHSMKDQYINDERSYYNMFSPAGLDLAADTQSLFYSSGGH